jgi:hypothetical protein
MRDDAAYKENPPRAKVRRLDEADAGLTLAREARMMPPLQAAPSAPPPQPSKTLGDPWGLLKFAAISDKIRV